MLHAAEIDALPRDPCREAGQVALAAGSYDEAEADFRAAVASAEALEPRSSTLAAALLGLAQVHLATRRMREAEELAGRAVALFSQTDSRGFAAGLRTLGFIAKESGRHDVAETVYLRAAELQRRHASSQELGLTLNNLGVLYGAMGRSRDAAEMYREALAIWLETQPEGLEMAMSLNNLAQLLRQEGNHAEAERLLKWALSIRLKVLGPNHPAVAQSLNNLSAIYFVQGKLDAARPLLDRALGVTESFLGPEHPEVARMLENLAILDQAQGEDARAEALLRRALRIREASLGETHPAVAANLERLGRLVQKRGDVSGGQRMLDRALSIRGQTLDASTAPTMPPPTQAP